MRPLAAALVTVFLLALTACDRQAAVTDVFSGSWMSGCVDFGAGQKSRIYSRFDGSKSFVAIATFANVGCTGTYTLTDTLGSPVTELTYESDFELQSVTDLPANYYVLKTTRHADSLVTYAVIFRNSTGFDEIVTYASPHAAWADWLTEPEVTAFVADPARYVPTSKIVFHFTAGTLP